MRLLFAPLLLVACGGGVPIAEPPTVEDAAEQAQFALANDLQAYCGAVSISPRLAVTARHCLRGDSVVRYAVPDRDWFAFGEAWSVAEDLDRDLAIISLDEPRPIWLPVQVLRPARAGDRVRNRAGWTTVLDANRWVRIGGGTVAISIETEAPARPGTSGTALIDRFGSLVGVCRGFDLESERGDYIPAAAIAELWAELETKP